MKDDVCKYCNPLTINECYHLMNCPRICGRKIVAAACKYKDKVYWLESPARHGDIIKSIIDIENPPESEWPICPPRDQGFIDDKGEFVGREEAYYIAKASNQIIEKTGNVNVPELFSEDLW